MNEQGPADIGGIPSPPPPPPGLFPGQQTGQQPAATPAPAGQPPRKKGGKLLAVIIGLVGLCAVFSCAAVLLMGLGGGEEKAVTQAEVHFDAASSAVETASAAIEAERPSFADADKALRVGRDELAAARAAIEPLDDSQGKADYLAALEAATQSIDALQDMIVYLDTASGMAEKAERAGKAGSRSNDDLNDAISLGNSGKYSQMKTEATRASKGFAQAQTLFAEAHKMDNKAGLDKAAKQAQLREKLAKLVIAMADDGKAGRVSAYNKKIDEMKKLQAKAEGIPEPAVVSNPNWAQDRLGSVSEEASESGTKADKLRAKALEEFGL